VLRELDAQTKPVLRVMNKADLLTPEKRRHSREDADGIYVSALKDTGIAELLAKIDALVTEDPVVRWKLRIPQSEGKILAQVEGETKILSRAFRGEEVQLEVQGPQSYLRGLEKFKAGKKK
jgi:GTP-binding protein HflX